MTLNASRKFDADEIWDLVERENVTVISLVGDAMARPAGRRARAPGRATVAVRARLRRRDPLPRDQAGAQRTRAERRDHRRVRRIGDGRQRRGRRHRQGSALPDERVDDRDHRDRRRRARSARSGCSPGAVTFRSATTRTRRRPRPPSSRCTACAGRFPATGPSSRTTARSTCSAAVRSASTPAARRSSPKRSRPC